MRSKQLNIATSVGFFVVSLIVKDISIVGALLVCAGATGVLYQGLKNV